MTITCPSLAASTKCKDGEGDSLSLAGTIWTVKAGPQILTLWSSREGENMSISGMWPPLLTPNLTSASDTSHDVNCAIGFVVIVRRAD